MWTKSMRPPSAGRTKRLWPVLSVLVCLLSLINVIAASEGDAKWFKFDKSFIQTVYPLEVAFGELALERPWKVGPLHTISCSANDGEFHVGAYDSEIGVSSQHKPISRPASGSGAAWGIVAEPINVTSADRTEVLQYQNQEATWRGFLRVWNEGHWHGHTKKRKGGYSNPNHVVEIHPAWALLAGQVEKEFPVGRVLGFKGYGLSKFDDERYPYHPLNPEEWLKVYQTSKSVFVQLAQSANFFSLPVRVRERTTIANGSALSLRLDVCASRPCGSDYLYRDLRAVTVPGTDSYPLNQSIEVLGLFSVNLRTAMTESIGATHRNSAVAVPEALEFFVYGRTSGAVRNSSCEPETGGR